MTPRIIIGARAYERLMAMRVVTHNDVDRVVAEEIARFFEQAAIATILAPIYEREPATLDNRLLN
jgi:hypothetical protein